MCRRCDLGLGGKSWRIPLEGHAVWCKQVGLQAYQNGVDMHLFSRTVLSPFPSQRLAMQQNPCQVGRQGGGLSCKTPDLGSNVPAALGLQALFQWQA